MFSTRSRFRVFYTFSYPLGGADMFCWTYFTSLRSRWTWPSWCKSKPKSVCSFSISTGPPSCQTIHVHSGPVTSPKTPPTATSKVPAVAVDEGDMYSVLDDIFGKGTYKVSLHRDVYRIAASRKLTPVRA